VLKHSARTSEAFENLDRVMDQLLSVLRQGNWDSLPELESSLLPALDAVQRAGSATVAVWENKNIVTLQQKLEEAIRECQERKNQIAPLLDSLDLIREKSPDV
jgi:hypothetical protein